MKKKSTSVKTKSSFFLSAITSFVKEQIGNSINSYIEEEITPRAIRFSEVSIFFIIGFILLLVGIAQFLASLLSFLGNGLNYILLGVILLLVAYFLSKSNN